MSLNNIKINNTTNVKTGVVYDISKATAQTYDTLSAALGTDGNNVPSEVREGGMSVRFVLTIDNKYVQYRLMTNTWSTTIRDWQGVDEDLIDYRSNNLAKSSVVVEALIGIESQVSENQYFTPQTHFDDSESDLSISDENNNVLVEFLEGNIKTKNFDSRHLCTIEGNTLIIN